jgi:hypothetical protein
MQNLKKFRGLYLDPYGGGGRPLDPRMHTRPARPCAYYSYNIVNNWPWI